MSERIRLRKVKHRRCKKCGKIRPLPDRNGDIIGFYCEFLHKKIKNYNGTCMVTDPRHWGDLPIFRK